MQRSDMAPRFAPAGGFATSRGRLGRFSALPFDLQLFAGEKTEPATEKRREEARERGNVAKSTDINSVLLLLAAFLTLRYYGPQMFETMSHFLRYSLEHAIHLNLTPYTVNTLFTETVLILIKLLLPLFLVLVVTGIMANLAQTGFLFSTEALMPDLNKINPIAGIENLVSWKSIGELVKSILKIVVIAWVPYSTLVDRLPFLVRLMDLEPMPSMLFILQIAYTMAIKIIFILLVLAIGDWFFQSWRYEESLKMSKEEIKEEYKQREGDPQVKAKIRERQRKMASRKMMGEVPKATVVVTNPTHLAVALRYERESQSAPMVVAKGAGLIARRIKEIAAEHQVPVMENKPLARALFDSVEIGEEIPPDLFNAVAEVLAAIYKAKGQTA